MNELGHERLYGPEIEFGGYFRVAGDQPYNRYDLGVASKGILQLLANDPEIGLIGRETGHTLDGSRYYVDGDHLEGAGAEAAFLSGAVEQYFQTINTVARLSGLEAMIMFKHENSSTQDEELQGTLYFDTMVRDLAPERIMTWGDHYNMLTLRQVKNQQVYDDPNFLRLLATARALAYRHGAGWMDPDGTVSMSQKIIGMSNYILSSNSTTLEGVRPLINTRNEPLMGSRNPDYERVHSIGYDGNMMEFPVAANFAYLSLPIHAYEQGVKLPDNMVLADPVRAAHAIGTAYPLERVEVELENGDTVYEDELARDFVARIMNNTELPHDEEVMGHEIYRFGEDTEENPRSLGDRSDSVAKLNTIWSEDSSRTVPEKIGQGVAYHRVGEKSGFKTLCDLGHIKQHYPFGKSVQDGGYSGPHSQSAQKRANFVNNMHETYSGDELQERVKVNWVVGYEAITDEEGTSTWFRDASEAA